jgi:hypothetical protein
MRAANTEANSRILRDFLLQLNTGKSNDPNDPEDSPHSLEESAMASELSSNVQL